MSRVSDPLNFVSGASVHAVVAHFSSKPLIVDPEQVLAARLKCDLDSALTHRRRLLSKPASCSGVTPS
jgi:hypothetical protein